MKFNIPLPFYYVQSDIKLRKEKEFNDFQFLFIMLFYALSNGEISKQKSLKDSIKEFLNIDEKFFEFIKKELLIKLIENDVIIYEKNISEISEDDMIGYYKLNENIKKNLDNNIFKGFEDNNREATYYIYKNLISISNWEMISKKIKMESHFIDENNYFNFDLNEIYEKNKNQIVNSIDSYVNKNESGYKWADIQLLDKDSKIKFLDNEINLNFKDNVIYPETTSDIEILESLYDLNKQNYISDWLSKELSLDNTFHENNSSFNFELKFSKSLSIFDYEIEKIKEIDVLINNLFTNPIFDYLIFDDKIYTYTKSKKKIYLEISENKEITSEISLSLLNLFEINQKNQNEIIEKIVDELNWEKLVSQLNKIPNIFKEICYLAAHLILETKENYDEEKLKNIINFLSSLNINYNNFENIKLNNCFFKYTEFPKFIKELFEHDAKNKRKFENEFINFDIENNLQRKLNNFYEFDYLKKDKYFKSSAEEERIQKMKNFIKNNYEINDLNIEKILEGWKIIKNSFNWINHSKISNEFEAKINKIYFTSVEKIKKQIEWDAISLRKFLEEKIAKYGDFKQDEANSSFKKCLEDLKKAKKITDDELQIILDTKKLCNGFVHFNTKTDNLKINQLNKDLENLKSKKEKIEQIIKKWGV